MGKSKKKINNEWLVYLLKCADTSLYCGITKDLDSRIEAHNTGKGAKYTKGRCPVELVASSEKMPRSEAMRLEIFIKKQPAVHKVHALKKGKIKK